MATDTPTLQASERKRSGSSLLKQMRREGSTPAILYGAKEDNLNLKVSTKSFSDLLHHSASESILVNLEVEGAGTKMAMIQDVQHHPLTGAILHADFHAVSATDTIHATIPVELEGEAKGVKAGGVLDQLLYELEIACLPAQLPEVLHFDVSHLEMGSALHVGEVTFPDGVTPSLNSEVVIASVSEPRVSGDEEEADAGSTPELEVTSEKKETADS
ncbi:MAG: 50S ribosomal protein L25 [Verrucomicrobiota bacterium]